MNWYRLHLDQLFAALESKPDGLSIQEVRQRLEKHGPNQLGSAKHTTLLQVFFRQFANILIYILLAAALLALALGKHTDSFFIFFVLIVNSLLGTWQEWQAEQSAKKLQQLVPTQARVRRSGQEETVDAVSLVPGDIVIIESGGKVPADLRLLEAHTLKVNEALLTGESEGVDKEAITFDNDVQVADRLNMAWAGSCVLAGKGIGMVVATGSKTQMGNIAHAVEETAASSTPLLIRFARLTNQIGVLVIGSCGLIGSYCWYTGMPLHEALLFTIGLIVSSIPEGLPIAVTVALSRGTQRMAARKVIVRKLAAVEGLGSCDCIATDKTGTLTQNTQTIEIVSVPENGALKSVLVEDAQKEPDLSSGMMHLVRVGICSGSASVQIDGKKIEGHGDQVDLAFHHLGLMLGIKQEVLEKEITVHKLIPFDSELRFSAALCQEDNKKPFVLIKGASEVIVPLCTHLAHHGKEDQALDRSQASEQTEQLYNSAYRVLALAQAPYDGSIEQFDPSMLKNIEQCTMLGLVGMIDPIRSEALRSVKIAQQTGVTVIMITGDHPTTAFAIAKRLGIANDRSQVMEGPALEELTTSHTPEELATLVAPITVFARVSPLQKLAIVQARKALGNFVAVTGDGVNDAPALKAAHIGVAMGSGTDIAKETASIVITDDNFSAIVAGIQEGRLVYANLRKIVYLLVATGYAEVLFIVLTLLFKLPMPLFALQLLWLNIVTNGIQDIALAFEEEPAILRQRRYLPNENIFNGYMTAEVLVMGSIMGIICTLAWHMLLATGYEQTYARNVVFLLFVMLQNAHALNCRSEYQSTFTIPLRCSRILLGGVAAALGTHIVAMHVPGLRTILGIGPVDLIDWLWTMPLAASIVLCNEVFKFMYNYTRKQV